MMIMHPSMYSYISLHHDLLNWYSGMLSTAIYVYVRSSWVWWSIINFAHASRKLTIPISDVTPWVDMATSSYTFLSFCEHEQDLPEGYGGVLIYGMEGSCDLLIKLL